MSFHATGTVSSDEFFQLVTVWSISPKGLVVEESLDATLRTDSIGIVIVVPGWPTHMRVPTPTEKNHRSGPYPGGRNAKRPSPTPKGSARHV